MKNLYSTTKVSLNLNQVMQDYRDLLKYREKGQQKSIATYFLPRSSSTYCQSQSPPMQVTDKSKPSISFASAWAELISSDDDDLKT